MFALKLFKKQPEKFGNLLDLGDAIIVSKQENMFDGSLDMQLNCPFARYRCFPGTRFDKDKMNIRGVENYQNSWGHRYDDNDHLIVAPKGKFYIHQPDSKDSAALATIFDFLSTRGFKVEMTNSALTFESKLNNRALYINKYPHTSNPTFAIVDFQNQHLFQQAFQLAITFKSLQMN